MRKIGILILIVLILAVLIKTGYDWLHKPVIEPPRKSIEANNPAQEKTRLLIKQLEQAIITKNTRETIFLMKSISDTGISVLPLLTSSFMETHNPEFQITLVKTMGMIKEQATIKALSDLYKEYSTKQPALNVQKEIIITLSFVGEHSVFDSFIDYLKTEKKPEIRETLCDCLIAIGDIKKIDAVIKANQDNPLFIQDLTAIKSKLEKNKVVRNEVVEIEHLDLSASASITKLDDILKSDNPLAIRLLALQKLEKANTGESIKVLLKFVESSKDATESDKTIRINAIAALTKMRINEAESAIKELLEGKEAEIRKKTVEFLGAFGDKTSIPLLNQVAATDSVPEIRTKAQNAIEDIKKRK